VKRHPSDVAWDFVELTHANDFNASKVKIKSRQLAKEVVKLIDLLLQGNEEVHTDDKIPEDGVKRLKALRSMAVLASKKIIKLEPTSEPLPKAKA
jgi:hypothetical protein